MCGNTDPYYVLMGRVIQKFRKAARMKQHELAADLKTTRGHIAASSELRRIFSPTYQETALGATPSRQTQRCPQGSADVSSRSRNSA